MERLCAAVRAKMGHHDVNRAGVPIFNLNTTSLVIKDLQDDIAAVYQGGREYLDSRVGGNPSREQFPMGPPRISDTMRP